MPRYNLGLVRSSDVVVLYAEEASGAQFKVFSRKVSILSGTAAAEVVSSMGGTRNACKRGLLFACLPPQ